MDAKRLRGTENYVYSIDDLIGKGATCEVYKGIHKVSGEVHALKIFESRLRTVALREIDALKSLQHENIVAFFGQETDRDTNRVVAVMEYCDKSLYISLCEPENRFGLTEDEFFRFFKHTVAGMRHLREHGFLHRDIKPGNILIVQDENGSNIYKLSDFGTAKPVLETEAFQSLVGTEEYLHPNIFRAAFIDQGMSREFDAAADLWSLGATLYHAATGRVPFQPYQGRNNKALMFQMITQKEFGVIAGEQRTQGGEVIWTKELPNTCRMSRWLKDSLAEVLCHLLEGDPKRAMTFEAFFQAAEDIVNRHIVYVFSTTSAKHFRLYLKQDCVYSDIQQEISIETNIPPRDQLLRYEECMLSDLVLDKDPLIMYPKMSMSVPLVMIRSTNVGQCTMPEEKHFWYHQSLPVIAPEFSQSSSRYLDEDYRVAKSVCESIAVIQAYVQDGCLTQELFEKTIQRTERWKDMVIDRLKVEVELYKDRVKDLRHIHKAITENGAVQCCVQSSESISIEHVKLRVSNCTVLLGKVQDVVTDSGITLYLTGCVDGNKCQKKIARLLERAKEKRDIMEARKRRSRALQYHEEQLHNFDKKQLTDVYQAAVTMWTSHCQQKLTEVHNHFLKWHEVFAELQTRLESLQKEIRATKSAIKKYMRSFKVSSDLTSLSSVSSMASISCDVLLTMAESEAKRRYLATSLIRNLDVVKSGQAEIRRMVSESEELQIKSLEVMSLDDLSDFPTMTSSDTSQSTDNWQLEVES